MTFGKHYLTDSEPVNFMQQLCNYVELHCRFMELLHSQKYKWFLKFQEEHAMSDALKQATMHPKVTAHYNKVITAKCSFKYALNRTWLHMYIYRAE